MACVWKIEELQKLKEQNHGDALQQLVSDKTDRSLNQSKFPDDCFSLWLDLIFSACRELNADQAIKLLTIVCRSGFFKTYVGVHVSQLSADHPNLCNTIKHVIGIMTQISQRFPNSMVETIGLVEVISVKLNNALSQINDEKEKCEYIILSDNLNILRDDFMKHFMNQYEGEKPTVTNQPQIDESFREIPVLARQKDILYTTRNSIRPNKSKGAYESLEHYLDIQFKLYREDYISPIRECISEYVREISLWKHVHRLQDGRLYRNVRALRRGTAKDGPQYTISLDRDHATRIRWKNSRRLIFGTLVCISPDHFRSLYFAVVKDRDDLETMFQFVVVSATGALIPTETDLTMVESSAYFEAYRHVLASLQLIHEGDLPFERYIVYCNPDVLTPKYLLNQEGSALYDLYPIISDSKIWDKQCDEKIEVDVKSSLKWPSADRLHMDTSQFEAYKAALTKEFVLIQGPPGTGKTHVALQIAKTLLHNKSTWQGYHHKNQMLIVCYTNHALDQFVEGILKFVDARDLQNDILVRVGGRSKNENIETYTLNYKRRCYRNRHEEKEKDKYRYTCIMEMRRVQRDISTKKWLIDHCESVVLDVQYYIGFMSGCHIYSIAHKQLTKSEMVLKWLGITYTNWFRQASNQQSKYFEHNHKMPECHQNEITLKENKMIDVKTEAEKAEDERRIEEDDFTSNLHTEDFGFHIFNEGNALLTSNDYDLCFKIFLKSEIETSLEYQRTATPMSKLEVEKVSETSIWKLPFQQRWRLYKYWLNSFSAVTKIQLESLKQRSSELEKICQDAEMEIDKDILKQTTVIAMTTTGAARYKKILDDIAPKIVIVEEAAEVLEAHIITSLSPQCQHLILIGDHKQLEPKASVFELAIKYNLGLSMFERMLNNGLSFYCLERQHRMRPEISELVRDNYQKLVDNENVMEYDHVMGMEKDVFFITHSQPEEFREDIRSYSNAHEAEFIAKLCKYLLQQGYKGTQITILVAYTGQIFLLQEQMQKSEYEGVRICAVDNYQGEENDIILLSLVRSNTEDKIGFLNRENRICVALSRAKIGFYVIGDFTMLSKKCTRWKKVVQLAKDKERSGNGLVLYCQIHPKTRFTASHGIDFQASPEGGCERDCDARLDCGHSCRRKCHPHDASHTEYSCYQLCRRKCPNDHICQKRCHPESEKTSLYNKGFLSRYHMVTNNYCDCKILVSKSLECGHTIDLPCCVDAEFYRCETVVTRILKCGHKIDRPCCVDAAICKCRTVVTRILKCGHKIDLKCYVDAATENCETVVTRILKCGHKVDLECYVDAATENCETVVTRSLTCGHNIDLKCYVDAASENCETVVTRILKCGHKVDLKCYVDAATENCETVVTRSLTCGHTVDLKCYVNAALYKCKTKVTRVLNKCGHESDMECWMNPETHQCQQIVKKSLQCGHIHDMECYQNPETKICDVIVKKELTECEHGPADMQCSKSPHYHKCKQMVNVKRKFCEHTFMIACYLSNHSYLDSYRGRKCKELVVKTLLCGHNSELPCSVPACDAELNCREKVTISLPGCGHEKEVECHNKQRYNDTLYQNPHRVEDLKCMVNVLVELPCGHSTETNCYQKASSMEIECKGIYTEVRPCGHISKEKCADSYRSYRYVYCTDKCIKRQICGHMCKSTSCGKCTICSQNCENRCPHGRCSKLCLQKCDECHFPCVWECDHFKCSKTCSENCDRPRCDEECKHILDCGHQCPCVCGEPCPPTCLHCLDPKPTSLNDNHEKLVYLVCGHVFPVSILDTEFESLDSLTFLKCPECHQIVHWHPRYWNIIVEKKQQIHLIKQRIAEYIPNKKQSQNEEFPKSRLPLHKQSVYIAQAGTFINVHKRIIPVTEPLYRRLHQTSKSLNELRQQLLNPTSYFLSTMTSHMYRAAAMWLACLGSFRIYNKSIQEDELDIGDGEDINESEADTDDNEPPEVKEVQNEDVVKKTQLKEITSNVDVADKVWHMLDTLKTFTNEILMDVHKTLEQVLEGDTQVRRILDVPLESGMLIGVHVDDYTEFDVEKVCMDESTAEAAGLTSRQVWTFDFNQTDSQVHTDTIQPRQKTNSKENMKDIKGVNEMRLQGARPKTNYQSRYSSHNPGNANQSFYRNEEQLDWRQGRSNRKQDKRSKRKCENTFTLVGSSFCGNFERRSVSSADNWRLPRDRTKGDNCDSEEMSWRDSRQETVPRHGGRGQGRNQGRGRGRGRGRGKYS